MRSERGLWARLKTSVSLLAVCACLLLAPASVRAQAASSDGALASDSPQDTRKAPPPHPNRIYFGMWTAHLKRRVIAFDNNWVIGLTYRGFFGATFQNTFGRRAFTGGIQRTLVSAERGPLAFSFGGRAGFLTGYDGRLMRLARKTPILPLIQPFASIDVERIGFEVSYTFVVVSVAVSYKF